MKWRIQDFSDGEGRRQPVIGLNFIRNCMKIKEIGIERVRLVRWQAGGTHPTGMLSCYILPL